MIIVLVLTKQISLLIGQYNNKGYSGFISCSDKPNLDLNDVVEYKKTNKDSGGGYSRLAGNTKKSASEYFFLDLFSRLGR